MHAEITVDNKLDKHESFETILMQIILEGWRVCKQRDIL